MRIQHLLIQNFRNLAEIDLKPGERLNFFIGPNGAGKTSLLEAIAVLAKGRSFRSGNLSDLIGPAAPTITVFAQTADRDRTHRLGISRDKKRWRGKIDGEPVRQLAAYAKRLPLVLIEPGSHRLIAGSPDRRRRYLDWGVFHVKPDFLPAWRRFSRALRQRNACLKQPDDRQDLLLDSLDRQLADAGEQMTAARQAYGELLREKLNALLPQLSESLPPVDLTYRPGWSGGSLHDYLQQRRSRDKLAGATLGGPQRADLLLATDGGRARDRFSRGQQKLLATALLLAQAEIMLARDRTPVLLIDDLASEFDREHLQRILAYVIDWKAQTWLTGLDEQLLEVLSTSAAGAPVFHVEQGAIKQA